MVTLIVGHKSTLAHLGNDGTPIAFHRGGGPMPKQIHQEKQKRTETPLLLNEAEEVLQSDLRGIDPRAVENANFRSELDYEGYEGVEDYDNNVLNANTDELESDDRELNFDEKDRPEAESEEESLVDPQENTDARKH
jgi:hypothetical protein